MTTGKSILIGALCSLLLALAPTAHSVPAESEGFGYVQILEFDRNAVVIEGARYFAGPELRVEINGTYGAFTMLKPGMKVRFVYRQARGGPRELVFVEELGAAVVIEQA